MVTKYRNDYHLQVIFNDETVTIHFPSNPKRAAERWAESIRNIAMGNYSAVQTDDYLPPEITNLVDSAKGAFGALFVGGKKNSTAPASKQTEPVITTRKCVGCHAPLTGRAGSTASCPYCNTKQTL